MPAILLVEDDPKIGDLVRLQLESHGYDVTWKVSAAEATDAFSALFDLVLLDLMLPDGSGFSVLEMVRKTSDVPVIVLTAKHDAEDKVRGLDLGADDYVTKPFWTEELLARIRARLRRVSTKQGNEIPFGTARVEVDSHRVTVRGKDVECSPTEFKLLMALASQDGAAIRAEQLIEDVLQDEEASRPALQTHMSRLRKKLGPEGHRIETVWGIGYRLSRDADD